MAFFAASTDDAETNARFAKELGLDYPILSDPGLEVARAFGVVQGDRPYAARHTFYIGADGKLLFVDREVSVRSAGEDTVKRLEKLGIARKDASGS